MKIEKSLKLGIYRHYKGNLYEVLSTGRHSESEEWMVIYRTLYSDGSIWIRPFEMFTGDVEIDGKIEKRFSYMGRKKKKKTSKLQQLFPFFKWKQ